MIEKQRYIWLDGELVEWDRANVHIMTHSLHCGDAVVEGIRCYPTPRGRALFRLDAHLRRLFDSAKILGIPMTTTPDAIARGCRDLVVENQLAKAYLRPLVFLGEGSAGVSPAESPTRVAIMAWPWGAYLGEDGQRRGVRAKVSSIVRNPIQAWMTKAKTTGGYVNSMLAMREANEHGYDEAILLDVQGYVAEGPGENIFIVRDGRLFTTPTPTVLAGITRDTVLRLAERCGIRAHEQLFTRDELYIADEAFFTGTAAEITPIREVDGRTIGTGAPGPVTRRLQEEFDAAVHGRAAHAEPWLAHI
ncbi:MAG TPA: branched-chain amino acid transaminase [Sorangium sp.]|nr:branched-chain amino acid transaminase [Sorangium sp.]